MKEPDDLDDAIKAAELASTGEDFTRVAKKEANLAEQVEALTAQIAGLLIEKEVQFTNLINTQSIPPLNQPYKNQNWRQRNNGSNNNNNNNSNGNQRLKGPCFSCRKMGYLARNYWSNNR